MALLVQLVFTGSVSLSSLSLWLGLKLRIEASSPTPRSPPAAPPPARHLEVSTRTAEETPGRLLLCH